MFEQHAGKGRPRWLAVAPVEEEEEGLADRERTERKKSCYVPAAGTCFSPLRLLIY